MGLRQIRVTGRLPVQWGASTGNEAAGRVSARCSMIWFITARSFTRENSGLVRSCRASSPVLLLSFSQAGANNSRHTCSFFSLLFTTDDKVELNCATIAILISLFLIAVTETNPFGCTISDTNNFASPDGQVRTLEVIDVPTFNPLELFAEYSFSFQPGLLFSNVV